jgi:hypothetical protein
MPPDAFCRLLGYQRDELIGKSYGEAKAPNTKDVPTVFELFAKLGYMHGLWMRVSRRGTRILVRQESWIRPDSCFASRMEIADAGDSIRLSPLTFAHFSPLIG